MLRLLRFPLCRIGRHLWEYRRVNSTLIRSCWRYPKKTPNLELLRREMADVQRVWAELSTDKPALGAVPAKSVRELLADIDETLKITKDNDSTHNRLTNYIYGQEEIARIVRAWAKKNGIAT